MANGGDNGNTFTWATYGALDSEGKKDPWSRPHIRLVYTLAHYNDYARDHNYSPYLQVNQKSWGSFIGVKTEWWLF
ncbi:carbohydrate porin [Flavobacterium sp. ZB4R12]|uniref:carbohydrate porin n=1 Tax=Flavobacterium sp. ZB4R12 TaxID=3398732 RepID=UPI003AAE3532